MPRGVTLGIAAALLLLPAAARAHGAFGGGDGFYAGVLHPVGTPAHLLLLLALGLFLGQRPGVRADGALAAFAVALFTGLFAAAARLTPTPPGTAALAIAAFVGVLVAAALPLPRAADLALALAVGAAIGLDSAPDGATPRGMAGALAGTALGAGLLLLLVVQAAHAARRPWQRVGVRVVGSWTAASALLALALAATGRG